MAGDAAGAAQLQLGILLELSRQAFFLKELDQTGFGVALTAKYSLRRVANAWP